MDLTNVQEKKLAQALKSAFPTRDALEMMTYYELGESLDSISKNGNLDNTILELIRWSKTRIGIKELVNKAREQNRYNPDLLRFAEELGLD